MEKTEKQTAAKPVSQGVCEFCKTELAKNKMTQHLKFCKQRLASIAKQEEKSQKARKRLLHIVAEGRYNPQYWLHFEVPATEALWSLDNFLKQMWIDDLDHLSGFTIKGTDYSNEHPGEFMFRETKETDEEVSRSDNEEDKDAKKLKDEFMSLFMKEFKFNSSLFSDSDREPDTDPDLAAWIIQINGLRTTAELINFFQEEQTRMKKEERLTLTQEQGKNIPKEERFRRFVNMQLQNVVVRKILLGAVDRSMEVTLASILKVEQKFSYVYDYGSSTYINLRVVTEREGIASSNKEPVQLLARNTAPAFICNECGKPATKIAMNYYGGSIEDTAYCTKCAKKHIGEDGEMPIINSPRIGVL